MLSEQITRLARRYLIGTDTQFIFKRARSVELPQIRQIGLYIHIPFCKNECPYCPYNKVKYDSQLAEPYLKAVLSEIEQYYNRLGRIEISSIYIGGGTPTTFIDELRIIINKIKKKFIILNDICIETNPSDITEEVVRKLSEYGVSLVSLGVQSFDDKYLKLIGRSYKADTLYPAIERVLSADFKSVNLDLMFALPGQTIKDVLSDLKKATESGANQITTYPLFTFPYSIVGRYLKLKRVKMSNSVTRRRMYRAIHEHCLSKGFQRVSVWGFKRGEAPRYSSVTRDYYIGIGAGAGSHIPGAFYLNTFSVNEYVRNCLNNKLPIALKMDFTDSLSQYYWLYWRFYDTYIMKRQLFEVFDRHDRKIRQLLRLSQAFGLCEEDEERVFLTERGAFWIHLAQNYFVLNYIDKVWSVAMKEAWPKEVKI
jgi:putative oxygen-independent coproporphyrinogen III oxidase